MGGQFGSSPERRVKGCEQSKKVDIIDAHPITIDPVIFPVLARAAELAGVDIEQAAAGLIEPDASGDPRQRLLLADYFRLLHHLAEATNDEILAMSNRPLMPGAFHYVLQQTAKLSNFEALMQHFAHSFNMLHGGTYNHVFFRDDKIVYAIDVKGFPYPFDLSPQERGALIDCVLILVHSIFVMCVGEQVTETLSEIRTGSHFRDTQKPPHQLAFWPCRVTPDCEVFELEYSLAATNLVVDVSEDALPAEYDIYLSIATHIDGDIRQKTPQQGLTEKVCQLISGHNLSEEQTATHLEISVRTLRRQLRAVGTSFQTLRANTLNTRAKRLLGQNYLIEEVAERLGYSDTRSFRRAFVRWNDITPREYCDQSNRHSQTVEM